MKTKVAVVCLAVVISGCAIETTSISNTNGRQGYTMNCNSGIAKCHNKSTELCPSGSRIIEHANDSTKVVAHYGEYPTILNNEILTIECK